MGAEFVSFTVSGSTKRTEAFLRKMAAGNLYNSLAALAQEGVSALITATPKDSGLAADSWDYEVEHSSDSVTIKWTNKDVENGFPVAIMLQYGHGTGTGGYVQGQDYINPAMRPVFDRIADQVWKVVTSA
jgi:hypothetical protein